MVCLPNSCCADPEIWFTSLVRLIYAWVCVQASTVSQSNPFSLAEFSLKSDDEEEHV